MAEMKIRALPNGPYLIEGPITIVDPTGAELRVEKPQITLCRCGHSSKKPFCDSTHRTVGFKAADPAPR
ncbi:MAG: CDGSH iron-sulfur domain-containing protein [Deinococcus sp.]|nr:CDGSH iron-sulfur domain-containing protein [Deinococcus sp.]